MPLKNRSSSSDDNGNTKHYGENGELEGTSTTDIYGNTKDYDKNGEHTSKVSSDKLSNTASNIKRSNPVQPQTMPQGRQMPTAPARNYTIFAVQDSDLASVRTAKNISPEDAAAYARYAAEELANAGVECNIHRNVYAKGSIKRGFLIFYNKEKKPAKDNYWELNLIRDRTDYKNNMVYQENDDEYTALARDGSILIGEVMEQYLPGPPGYRKMRDEWQDLPLEEYPAYIGFIDVLMVRNNIPISSEDFAADTELVQKWRNAKTTASRSENVAMQRLGYGKNDEVPKLKAKLAALIVPGIISAAAASAMTIFAKNGLKPGLLFFLLTALAFTLVSIPIIKRNDKFAGLITRAYAAAAMLPYVGWIAKLPGTTNIKAIPVLLFNVVYALIIYLNSGFLYNIPDKNKFKAFRENQTRMDTAQIFGLIVSVYFGIAMTLNSISNKYYSTFRKEESYVTIAKKFFIIPKNSLKHVDINDTPYFIYSIGTLIAVVTSIALIIALLIFLSELDPLLNDNNFSFLFAMLLCGFGFISDRAGTAIPVAVYAVFWVLCAFIFHRRKEGFTGSAIVLNLFPMIAAFYRACLFHFINNGSLEKYMNKHNWARLAFDKIPGYFHIPGQAIANKTLNWIESPFSPSPTGAVYIMIVLSLVGIGLKELYFCVRTTYFPNKD